MASGYRAVQWSRFKRAYDLALTAGLLLIFVVFMIVSMLVNPSITIETLLIRGSAAAAFALLTVILCIGPLARLDPRLLPLLHNRRHLGVTMFLVAAFHAALATVQHHALGDESPLVSLLTAYSADYDPFSGGAGGISHLPFEPLGLGALCILFLMAATSHDFWLRNLGASWWKRLHILVLFAYGLVVLHISFGALQSERSPVLALMLLLIVIGVYGLHLLAGLREAGADRLSPGAAGSTGLEEQGYQRACATSDLIEGQAHVAWLGGQRVAVWLVKDRIWATSNVCRHQGGPIGEGKVVDSCITCPWHGWQYRPEDGQSPPPFEERVETFRVELHGDEVWIHPQPDPPGTPQPPVMIGDTEAAEQERKADV